MKLDDAFADHPKVMAAGPLASWLHVCALLYCSRLLTDGYIPIAQVRKLADIDGAIDLADRLVEVGLWDRADDGYQVHDYLDYNPSREDTLRRREYDRSRKTVGSSIKEESQRNPRGIDTDSEVSRTRNPVPRPVPTPVENLNPTEGEATPRTRAKAATAVAVVDDQPHAMVVAFCEELGTDAHTLAPKYVSQQRGIAKGLIEQGYSIEKVRLCARFMLSEKWRESPFDLRGVRDYIGKWEARGSPETAGALKAQRQPEISDIKSNAMRSIMTVDLSDITEEPIRDSRGRVQAQNGGSHSLSAGQRPIDARERLSPPTVLPEPP